jgi:hypothetical protein
MRFLKDKRVDKMLNEAGIKDAEIFHSPIFVTLRHTFFLLFFVNICFQNWFVFGLSILICLIDFLLMFYMNNSVVITNNFMYVINPNYPFKKIKPIEWKNIKHIQIDCEKPTWIFLLLIFSNNSIQIKMTNETKKYYCIGIEQDSFDENAVEKTMEMLEERIKEKGINCDANYSYL